MAFFFVALVNQTWLHFNIHLFSVTGVQATHWGVLGNEGVSLIWLMMSCSNWGLVYEDKEVSSTFTLNDVLYFKFLSTSSATLLGFKISGLAPTFCVFSNNPRKSRHWKLDVRVAKSLAALGRWCGGWTGVYVQIGITLCINSEHPRAPWLCKYTNLCDQLAYLGKGRGLALEEKKGGSFYKWGNV